MKRLLSLTLFCLMLTFAASAQITGTLHVCVGSTTTLHDADTGGTWYSYNTSIATIGSHSGIVTGISAGVDSIVYSDSGHYTTVVVTVNAAPSSITGLSTRLCVGQCDTLHDSLSGGTWSSSSTSVVYISSTYGIACAISAGVATITYTSGSGCIRTAAVTVNSTPVAISGTTHVCVGGTTSLYDTISGGSWSSSNTSIATVGSSTGIVTGGSAGTVTITYSTGSSCYVTIVVTVNPAPSTISGGSTVCTGNTLTLTDGTTGGIWTSSNTSVATIGSATGVVTGGSSGYTIITYILSTGCYATKTVIDSNCTSPTDSISGSHTLCVGSTEILTDGTSGGTWSSSNTSIATVGTSGLVTGASAGIVTISYTAGGSTATFTVTVNSAASISGPSGVCIGSSITLTGSPSGGSWSSGNTAIATVTSGLVTGAGAGVVNIYYENGGCYAYHTVTVSAAPAAITGTTTVSVGGTTSLSDATSGGTWSSSNTSIATISTSGVVTGVSGGTCTITYSTGGCYVTTTITVTGSSSIDSISGSGTVCVGSTITLTDGTSGGTWSSSNTSIATVSSVGVVTGVSAGTVTISYTVGSSHVTKTVVVSAAPAAVTGPTTVAAGSNITLSDATAGGSWSSTNTAIATVNATTGVVTGVSAGTVYIKYTLPGGCYVYYLITVTGGSSIDSISGSTSVCVGSTITLTDGTTGGTWSSSNTSIATVGSTTGVVTGVSAGTVTITYTVGTSHVTITITVNAAPAAVSGPTTVAAGSNITLTDGTSGGSWSSTNTAIATVNATTGVVTGVSGGTVYIKYTLSSGCYVYYLITVTGGSSIDSISGSTSVCVGSTITLTDGTTGGTWSSSNTSIATVGSTTGVVTGVSAGTVTITYTVGTSHVTITIAVNAAPTAISGPTTVAAGSNITLTDGTGGGSWSSTNTAIATVNATTGVVTGVSAGTVYIKYTLSSGCYVYYLVTVTGSTSLDSIGGSSSVCVGSTITLTDGTSGGTWSSSNTSIATVGSTTGVVTGVSAGTVTITYTVGSSHVTKTITVSSGASISGGSTVCTGSTVTLTGTPSGGTWYSSNTSIATVSAGVVTGVSSGTAVIYYSNGGCSAYHYVTVNPTATISGSSSLCSGTTTTLTASISGGTWSSGNTAVATVSTAGVVTAVGAGVANIYYLTGTCYAYHTVTVNAAATISGSSSLCAGSTTTLTASVSGGTWSSGSTAVATVGSATGVVTAVGAGVTNIYYDNGGCYAYHTVTVNASPTLYTVTGGGSYCTGGSGVAVGLSGSSTGVRYQLYNGSSAVGSPVTGTGSALSFGLQTTAGTYTVVATNTTTGCSATMTGYAVITVGSTATITGSSALCSGSTTTLTASVSGGVWSSGNTAVATVGSTGVVTAVGTGTTNIYYNDDGCTAYHTVTVNTMATISGASSICAGSTTTLTASPTGGSWSSGNTAIATVNTAGLVTGVGAGIVNIYYSMGGCYAYHTMTVTAASSTISGPSSLCAGSSVTLTGSPSGGTWASSYTVSATVGSTTGLVTGIAAGTSTIYYSIGGCFAYRTETVTALPASISGPSSVCAGSSITLTDATAGGAWSSSSLSIATITTGGVLTGVSAGVVTVSYVVGSCSADKGIVVDEAPAAITGLTSVLAGYSITLADAVSGGTWLSGNTAIATVNPVTGVVTGVSAGSVDIYYSIGGCTVYTTIEVTDIPERKTSGYTGSDNSIKVYPNPTSGSLYIQWDNQTTDVANVIVTDVTGRQVYASTMSINYASGQQQFDLSALKSGVYIISVKSDNIYYTGRLIIENK